MTEQFNCVSRFVDARNEASRQFIMAQYLLGDDAVLQRGDNIGRDPVKNTRTDLVAEAHNGIDHIKRNLRFDKDEIRKHVSEVEEGVVAVKED